MNLSEYNIPLELKNNYLNNILIEKDNYELNEEFKIENLGIDLNSNEFLLTNLYYVGSELPMLKKNSNENENLLQFKKLKNFSNETLFFMFYFYSKEKILNEVSNELKNRFFIYDIDKKLWKNQNGNYFDIDKWIFI